MYSLVLMTAMAGTPDAPQFNGYFRDLFGHGGCSGCTGCGGGAARYSCYGGGCCGADNGCCGGGAAIFGIRDRVRSWWNANGCCGGTVSLGGCCGGSAAYSCTGGTAAYSCFGGPAVSYTPVMNGGLSCYGGPVPSAPPPVFGPYSPPPAIPYADPSAAPAPPSVVPERQGFRPATGFGPPAATVSSGTRAAVIVRLPSDAKLYADGTPLRLAGAERRFTTPELPAGMEFTYRMTAEYERNGEVVSVSKRVTVRAGGSEVIEFTDLTASRAATGAPAPLPAHPAEPTPAVAVSNPGPVSAPAVLPTTTPEARATITVRVPAGAALFVDGNRNPSAEPVRRFTTPPIPAGREFAYLLRVEVVRNGQPESVTQKVTFRAGEHSEVDFTAVAR
jgi:uncharacterized protein (TIGR03000 family)